MTEEQQLIADLFAQYTKLYGVPVAAEPFITHNPEWRALYERAILLGVCL